MNTNIAVCAFITLCAALLSWAHYILRCRHDWEPVVERELPSRAEELKKAGEDIRTWRHTGQLTEIARKTFFAIVSCKKCGAVKEFKVTT